MRLHGNCVHARHESGERVAHHIYVRERSLFKARNRRTVVWQFTSGKIRRVVNDQHAVDPRFETVVVLGLQHEPVELRRVGHRELFPQEDGGIQPAHVSQRRHDKRFSIANRQRPDAPRAVIKRSLPPRRGRAGSLVRSFHVLPRTSGGQQRRVLQRCPPRSTARGSPASGEIVVERRMDELDRVAIPRRRRVAHRRPWKAESKTDLVHDLARGISERQRLAAARQPGASIRIERPHRSRGAVLRLYERGILGYDHIASRRKIGGRERVGEPVREGPARQIHRVGARIVELHKFARIGFYIRVVVDFIDDDRCRC